MRALVLLAVFATAAASAQAPNITVTAGDLSATLDVGESTSRAILVANGGDAPLTYRVRTATGEGTAVVYAGASSYGSNGTVYALDPSTGAVRSSFAFPDAYALLAFDGGTLYALNGLALNALNPTTGETVRSVTLAVGPTGYYEPLDVAVADGRLAVLANTDTGFKLDLFDPATGVRARQVALGLDARAVAAGDGVYYVAGFDATAGQVVVTLDAASGARLRALAFPATRALTYSRALGALLAMPDDGYSRTVRVYDAATGSFLSSFTLPSVGPYDYSTFYRGLAADEGTEAPWLSVTPRTGTVAAGGQAGLTLGIDAGRVLGGTYAAEVVVASNDPDEPEVRLAVSLVAVGVAKIAVRPASIDLGPLYAGTPVTTSFVVRNPGSDTLRVSSVASSDARLAVSADAFELLPGDSTSVQVDVTPTGGGDIDATVTLATNVEGRESVEVEVTGTDAFPPVLAVAPTTVAIDGIAGEAASATLTVSNTGQGPLAFGAFAGLRAEVRPSRREDSDVRLATATTDAGWVTAGREPAEARQSLGRVSADSTFDVPPLTLLAADGDDDGPVDVRALRGAVDNDSLYLAIDFEALPTDVSASVLLDLDTDPNTGNGYDRLGAEAEVYVYYYSYFGATYGEVRVYSPSGYYYGTSWKLDGNTLLFAVPVSQLGGLGGAFDLFVGVSGSVYRDGGYSEGGYDIVPDDGVVAVQAASAGWLSVSPEAGTVAPGASQELTVTADAAALVGGDYQSLVIIEGNGPVRQRETVTVELSVTGTPAVAAGALAFGQVYVGYPSTQALTVSNPGTDRLTLTAVASASGALVADLGAPVEVAPGASVQVPVSVTAAEPGAFSATLTLETDAPTGPLAVAVTATAVRPPVATLSAESVALAVPIGGATEVPITLDNPGGVPLTYRTFLLAGDGQSSDRVETEPLAAAADALATDRESGLVRTQRRPATAQLSVANDLPTLFADPDEGLAHDVVEVRGAIDDDAGVLQLEFVFARAVTPSALGGSMFLDRDQDAGTGQTGYSLGDRQLALGVETVVDIWPVGPYGEVYVYESVPPYRGRYLPAVVSGTSLRFDLPLDYVGSGAFDFASYVVHTVTSGPNADYVPDAGVASVNARVGWLAVTPRTGTVAAGGSAALALRVDATDLAFDTYRARLVMTTNAPGTPSLTVPVTVEVVDNTATETEAPAAFALALPVPNPSAGPTRLAYTLAEAGPVAVTVFDAMGRRVLAFDAGVRPPGGHTVEVDASGLPAGVYMVRLQSGTESAVRPLSVVR